MLSRTQKLLREQFEELNARRAKIESVANPLREKRDAFKNEMMEKLRVMDAEIKEVEKEKYDLDMDLGRLARALGGRSMSDVIK